MRLTDTDALMERLAKIAPANVYCKIKHIVAELTTVDAEPVRHGKWKSMSERDEIFGYVYMCDNCGHGFVICENFHYCPNCGAKMECE